MNRCWLLLLLGGLVFAQDEVEEIAGCMEGLLDACSVEPGDVDRVFMTGGSSFVPAVRRIFERRFGGEKLRGGGELVSVASGLSLCVGYSPTSPSPQNNPRQEKEFFLIPAIYGI